MSSTGDALGGRLPLVGAVWRAPYELYAHSAVARSAGLPDLVVRALAAGEPSALTLRSLRFC
jgi:hypothetical protein